MQIDIIEILVLIAITSLLMKGWHAVTRHGMLLSFLGFDEAKREEKLDMLNRERDEEVEKIEDKVNKFIDEGGKTHVGETEQVTKIHQSHLDELQKTREYYRHRAKKIQDVKTPWIAKAYSECEVCMSSIWGTGMYFLYTQGFLTEGKAAEEITTVVFVLSVAGVMSMIQKNN